MRDDGTYKGTIASAYVAEDGFDKGEFVLKVDVNLDGGGAVTCRQSLKDSEASKRAAVMTALGIAWPFKFAHLKALAGNTIDINLKTSKQGRQNAYIATQREERILSPEEIDALTNRDLPF